MGTEPETAGVMTFSQQVTEQHVISSMNSETTDLEKLNSAFPF